ncbi:MAG: ABC transporter permease subunit, partial [Chloroflexota bacterium]
MPTQNKPTQMLVSIVITMARRLAYGLIILVAIVFVSNFGFNLTRTGNVQQAASSAWLQTGPSIQNLISGNLGTTVAGTNTSTPFPVGEVAKEALVRSLGLLAVSLTFASVAGTFLGVIAGIWRRKGVSLSILMVTLAGVSLPSFFTALIFQVWAINMSRLIPGGTPFLPVGGFGWDKHIVLPALVLAARPLAQITRMTFIAINETMSKDHVRTAYSKGLRRTHVILQHVLKNSLVTILTTIGISIRFSLSSLPIVESYFGWRGAGFMLLSSIFDRERNLGIVLAVSFGLLFIIINALLDIVYQVIDPRLRETADHISSSQNLTIIEAIQNAWAYLKLGWRDLFNRKQRDIGSISRKTGDREKSNHEDDILADEPGFRVVDERKLWIKNTLGNFSLMTGGILIFIFLIMYIFGPELAPFDPFITREISYRNGVLSVPPFPPSETYVLGSDMVGRDILSLILVGTQPTLTLAMIATLSRLLVGFILGSMAGWLNGGKIDRFILGLSETIASYPTLILAMILIVGLDIREGMKPFIIALSIVGSGEVMQYVRAQVMLIRPKPYIESAVAIGPRFTRIITHQVLPNLIPGLISIAALEMGAVLMILGELGFIGIYINGIARVDINYADVPEWASLLATTRQYARAYSWTAIYPAAAFFLSIWGFNLFGEGVRRMIENVGVRINRLFNRYTLIAVVGFFTLFFWFRGDTGAKVFFMKNAEQFSGADAYAHVQELTTPEMHGRALGSSGLEAAANYIAEEFRDYKLQAAGAEFSFFQNRAREYIVTQETPTLTIE